jgi:hypothetical protein
MQRGWVGRRNDVGTESAGYKVFIIKFDGVMPVLLFRLLDLASFEDLVPDFLSLLVTPDSVLFPRSRDVYFNFDFCAFIIF